MLCIVYIFIIPGILFHFANMLIQSLWQEEFEDTKGLQEAVNRRTDNTHSGRIISSCSTSGTSRVTLITNPVISHERGKDRNLLTTSGTYSWSSVHLHMEYISLS